MDRLKNCETTKLAMSRAKRASKENLDNSFKELGTTLTVHDLKKSSIKKSILMKLRKVQSNHPLKLYVPKTYQLSL